MTESQVPARSDPRRTWLLTVRELFQIFGLFLIPSRNRSSALYNMLASHNNLAEQSLYLNLGYWESAQSYDEACEALARKVGDAAQINEGDHVLDCGFGFGDQDAFWLELYQPEKIVGVNITENQVTLAKERFPDSRLDFQVGSATDLRMRDESFDKVMALESAFHFNTRDDFLREGLRVLKPGGRICMADIMRAKPPTTIMEYLAEQGGRALWQIPSGNLCEIPEYKQRLETIGFINVSIEAIGAQVYKPFEDFAHKRLKAPEVIARLNPLIRAMWSVPNSGTLDLEYVICTAEKPC
jgi:ubiquinone/menaquinone biosynthesis C-methylase UbiE